MYSQKLIDEIKRIYPDSIEINRLAKEGNTFLGRYLDDSSYGSVSLDEILLALSLEEIQAKARKIKEKRNLYAMWCEEDPRKQ